MRIIKNKAKSHSGNKYNGNLLVIYKVNKWNKDFQNYNEEKWMNNISEKINTGLSVTQEVCDNVITPLVEKQLNGLNKEYENE